MIGLFSPYYLEFNELSTSTIQFLLLSVLISASATGTIQIVKDCPEPEIIVVGDNISKMRQCKEEKKLVVTGGKTSKNMIKVWDLSTKENVFTGKNVNQSFSHTQAHFSPIHLFLKGP
jgi:hypothetical protein